MNKYLRYFLIVLPHLMWFGFFYVLSNNLLLAAGIATALGLLRYTVNKTLNKVRIDDEQ
jgi:hypothetical protein